MNKINFDCETDAYIVRQDAIARRLPYDSQRTGKSFQSVLQAGCIVEPFDERYENGECVVVVKTLEKSEDFWECKKVSIIPVPMALLEALLPVKPISDRIRILEDQDLCHRLLEIDVGSMVNVCVDSGVGVEPEPGLVRYKGCVSELGVGLFYGVELLTEAVQGNTNGSIRGKHYFKCPNNRGVFVTIGEIEPYYRIVRKPRVLNVARALDNAYRNENSSVVRNSLKSFPNIISPMPSHEDSVHPVKNNEISNFKSTYVLHLKDQSNSSGMSKAQPLPKLEKNDGSQNNESAEQASESYKKTLTKPPLKVGDRVVWISDTGPEFGIVRWLGHLPGQAHDDWIAGVEFDNPVGSGSGVYRKQQLFETKKKHASFIPLMGLVKADDFNEKHSTSGSAKEKEKEFRLIEDYNQPKSSHYCNLPSPPHGSRISDPPAWNNVLQIDLTDSGAKVTKNRNISATIKTEDKTVQDDQFHCNSSHHKVESQRQIKDEVVTNKTSVSCNKHSFNEMKAKDFFQSENIPDSNMLFEDRVLKHRSVTELKVRPPLVPEVQNNCVDDAEPIWQSSEKIKDKCTKEDAKRKTKAVGANGKPVKLNNINANDNDNFSDIVDGFLNPVNEQSKKNDLRDSNTRSPTLSTGGSSYYDTPEPGDGPPDPTDLGMGSVVEVLVNGEPQYGVIRWIGTVPEDKKNRKVAGIEMEDEIAGCTDGTFGGRRYFQCTPKKALFVNLNQCQKDGRFLEAHNVNGSKAKTFGQLDCPAIPGMVCPISQYEDLESLCGKYRGIQGHHNSCYLDATLFSMFTFTSVFDSLLFRPPNVNDVDQYEEVQTVLREEIVNPLRKNLYVRADRVMKLRTLLENLSSVTGLTSEEKDPEEFLTSLVAQILKAEPFLKLNSGQEAFHYQLFVEKDERLVLPTVQQLFEQSFLASDLKLKEVPSCLIIQMPRFGKNYKMYPRILPSQLLDVTDVIEDSPRQCIVCGKLAEFECKECFGQCGSGLESIAFCAKCLETAHSHRRRVNHAGRRLTVPYEFSILQDHCAIPRLYMELFAVVCIETSHYVAFVKGGNGPDAPWCFFDSMADRKGEQNGYNIPEMVSCPDLPYWLSDEGARKLQEIKDDRLLPEHAKRLLCDAYMCMYQSADIMMYR